MTNERKQFLLLLIAVIAAAAMIGSALWFKNTEHENAWLYILCAWLVFSSILEVCFRKK